MELFNFEKNDVMRFIEHELKTLSKSREPLKYVVKRLEKLGNSLTIQSLDDINLSNLIEREGKNYYWSVIKYGGITLVIRRYRQHLTIFTMVVNESEKDYETGDKPRTKYGAFTLSTNLEKFGEKHDEMMDLYYDRPLTDLSVIIKDLFGLLVTSGVYSVWNSSSLQRPDHIEINLIFSDNSILEVDSFIFCMEELSSIYLELFATYTMIKRLKELNPGLKIQKRYTLGKITTTAKDDYYHSVGAEFIDTMNGDKASFQDVYSLTRWYLKDIFEEMPLFAHNGEMYIEGGKLTEGRPAAYKSMKGETAIYKASYPKENFIALKKY